MTNSKHFNSLEDKRETQLIDPEEIYRKEAPHWWSTTVAVIVMIVVCGFILLLTN